VVSGPREGASLICLMGTGAGKVCCDCCTSFSQILHRTLASLDRFLTQSPSSAAVLVANAFMLLKLLLGSFFAYLRRLSFLVSAPCCFGASLRVSLSLFVR